MKAENNGFLVVASKDYRYYAWGVNLLEQIKDYYPEAKTCFVVKERFCDGREEVADHVVYCGDHYRAKLWGMSQSPFDKTFYIDADMECLHEDIATVFDELGDNDMVFNILEEKNHDIFVESHWPGRTFVLCGAVCLYTKEMLPFMKDWFELYDKQMNNEWWPTDENGDWDQETHPRRLKHWDQFTLWWLVNKEEKYKDLKIGEFKENDRWNYWSLQHRKEPMPDDVILYHRSFVADKEVYQS